MATTTPTWADLPVPGSSDHKWTKIYQQFKSTNDLAGYWNYLKTQRPQDLSTQWGGSQTTTNTGSGGTNSGNNGNNNPGNPYTNNDPGNAKTTNLLNFRPPAPGVGGSVATSAPFNDQYTGIVNAQAQGNAPQLKAYIDQFGRLAYTYGTPPPAPPTNPPPTTGGGNQNPPPTNNPPPSTTPPQDNPPPLPGDHGTNGGNHGGTPGEGGGGDRNLSNFTSGGGNGGFNLGNVGTGLGSAINGWFNGGGTTAPVDQTTGDNWVNMPGWLDKATWAASQALPMPWGLGIGLAREAGKAYNLSQSDAARQALGIGGLSFGQVLGGLLGSPYGSYTHTLVSNAEDNPAHVPVAIGYDNAWNDLTSTYNDGWFGLGDDQQSMTPYGMYVANSLAQAAADYDLQMQGLPNKTFGGNSNNNGPMASAAGNTSSGYGITRTSDAYAAGTGDPVSYAMGDHVGINGSSGSLSTSSNGNGGRFDSHGNVAGGGGNSSAWGGSGEKMAKGGYVQGDPAIGDNQPIRATPGEFMINRQSAEALGPNILHRLNDPEQARGMMQQPMLRERMQDHWGGWWKNYGSNWKGWLNQFKRNHAGGML